MEGNIKGAQSCAIGDNITTPQRTTEHESKKKLENLERKRRSQKEKTVGKSVIAGIHR